MKEDSPTMNLLRFVLHKIDHANTIVVEQKIERNGNLEKYIKDILSKVSQPDEKRIYKYPQGSLVEPALTEMLDESKFASRAMYNAERLLKVEINTQSAMASFSEIQRGILIQAVVELHDKLKIIIAKADFSAYLGENNNYQPEEGLPLKRKIFKAYCAAYNNVSILEEVFVFDPFNTKYWWREFFELEQGKTDELNTITAFEEIDSVLYRFKEEYPADHNVIRNKLVGFFKTQENQFSLNEVKKKVFEGHTALNNDFPLDKIVSRVEALAEKGKFDGQFTVVPNQIAAKKLREIIPLNPNMDLHIKDYVANLDSDVVPIKHKGQRYIQIRTDSGYKAFGGME
jgi:hypothetical protein